MASTFRGIFANIHDRTDAHRWCHPPLLRVHRSAHGWGVFSREDQLVSELFDRRHDAIEAAAMLAGAGTVVIVDDEHGHAREELFAAGRA